jgi:hypothetical protein
LAFFASSSFVILDCYCPACQVVNTVTYHSTSFLPIIGPSSVFRFISVCVSLGVLSLRFLPGVLSLCFLQLDSRSFIQYAALLNSLICHSTLLRFSPYLGLRVPRGNSALGPFTVGQSVLCPVRPLPSSHVATDVRQSDSVASRWPGLYRIP